MYFINYLGTIMFDMLKVLFYVLVVFGSDNYSTVAFARRCFDCVSITSCESALKFAEDVKELENRRGYLPHAKRILFNNATCGTDVYNPGLPKVCCSKFPRLHLNQNKKRPTIQQRILDGPNDRPIVEATTIPDKDEIEMHPNLRLLPNDMCGRIEGTRIVGGRVPKLYELPWMTLIAFDIEGRPKFGCGGSIINSRYILTAAHCVYKDGKLKTNIGKVRIGEFDYSSFYDCQGGDYEMCEEFIQKDVRGLYLVGKTISLLRLLAWNVGSNSSEECALRVIDKRNNCRTDIGIEETIHHEDFIGIVPQQADIALLRLEEPITFRKNVAPICLPVYSKLRRDRLDGRDATVAGWGATENETSSSKLMKVTVPILTDELCGLHYNLSQNLFEKSFCAGKQKKDSCTGDSGGPLIIESNFGGLIRMVQFGIVSLGPEQCGQGFPGIYTDVTKYMDWILNNIRE